MATHRKGQTAVVLGAGESGLAAARLLRAQGAAVRILDRDQTKLEAISDFAGREGCECIAGEHRPEHFQDVQLVVMSPGIPMAKIAPLLPSVGAPEVIGELELAFRETNTPILAVTGSNGKTTTVTMAARILEASGRKTFLGGNIGTPLAAHVLSGDKADVLVLEVSSFQLQTCDRFRPKAGALLNFSSNHLDYHQDLEEYLAAKLKLFSRQDAGDTAIFPVEMRPMLAERGILQTLHAKVRFFEPAGRFQNQWLLGEHNQANMEAAFQAANVFGVSENEAAAALAAFKPLGHRLERVLEKQGVLFVDDSKATTIEAMRAAILSFERPVRLLAGGVFKGGDLGRILPLLGTRVLSVGLFGASREIFEQAWAGVVPLFWEATLEPAVQRLYAEAKPGDVILLSPGTASFDLYSGYKARGDDFQRIAREAP